MARWGLYQNSIVLTFAPSTPPFCKLSIKFSERGGECLMETLGKRSLHWNISPLSISGLWEYPFGAISKGPWSPREVVFWPSWSVHRFLTKGGRDRLIYILPVGKYITVNSLFFEVTLFVIKLILRSLDCAALFKINVSINNNMIMFIKQKNTKKTVLITHLLRDKCHNLYTNWKYSLKQ